MKLAYIITGCILCCCCSVDKSCWTFTTPWTASLQAPLSSPSSRVCSNSCPLSQGHYVTISSSAAAFSSCLQSFPSWGSFPMRQLIASGGQSIGASASSSILPINVQGQFLLGLTGLISLYSNEFSRVFSAALWKHQFFSAQPPLWSHSHIWHDCWKNHSFDSTDLCQWSDVSFLLCCLCLSSGFPDSSVGKESTCNAGDPSSIPGSGRSSGNGICDPPQ